MVAARLQKKRDDLCSNTKPPLDLNPSSQGVEIMVNHSSATARVGTPHETETTQITISDALKRRAHSVIDNRSIDPQWRNIVRYLWG